MPSSRCCYCGRVFTPSIYHPGQKVCLAKDCQQRRRNEDHRRRYRSDPDYRLVCLESTQKWRRAQSGYQRSYRERHPDYVERNREAQHHRDRKRHLSHLVKNNLAFAANPRSAQVWLFGPGFEPLVKNNLAISEVIVFQDFTGERPLCRESCKEQRLSG